MIRLYYIMFVFLSLCNVSYGNRIVYVSVDGNDEYEGTLSRPFRTIERAIKNAADDSNLLTIILREGSYIQDETLVLSGLNNVVLTSYFNEKVYITGGMSIDEICLRKIEDQAILSRIKKEIQNEIRKIDFDDLGITISKLDKRGFEYKTSPAWNEIFINDQPLVLAQWPNDKMIITHKVINSGNNKSKGILGQGNPIIEYVEDEPSDWGDVTDGWICGYFGEGWADDMLPIEDVDKVNKRITIGSSSLYGFKADGIYRRWFVRNLPELIDLYGEYVNNASNNEIYFLPPNEIIRKIQISTLKEPIISIRSSKNILIKNITIECSRGIGVQIEESNNILIDSCIVRNVGNIGIKIGGDTYNNGVQNSYIYNTGAGGIELNGGNRKQLMSGHNFVHNCKIHDFNRIEKAKRPAINLKGAGNKISNVEIYNAPSMGIYVNGNNHVIEYVDIHHVCKEAYDIGAIYTGRNPTERGHKILYSYFHDILSPFAVTAIYHDDGACGMDVYGCIFNNISCAPVLIGGGQDINYDNNIFMNLPYAIQIDNRFQIWRSYSKWLNPNNEFDTKFKAIDFRNPPYSIAYPELLEYWENEPAKPKRNNIRNNIIYNITNKVVKGDSIHLSFGENYMSKSFDESWDNIKSDNFVQYQLEIPNFEIIPVHKIGCSLPNLK